MDLSLSTFVNLWFLYIFAKNKKVYGSYIIYHLFSGGRFRTINWDASSS